MKTIKQWFIETLPKEIADEAIEETIRINGEDWLKNKRMSFRQALMTSFPFSKSTKGRSYWISILSRYQKKPHGGSRPNSGRKKTKIKRTYTIDLELKENHTITSALVNQLLKKHFGV